MPALVYSRDAVQPRDRLLRLPEVERVSGIRKSLIYSLMREGKFPRNVAISRRVSVWPESAVLAWVNARIRGEGVE